MIREMLVPVGDVALLLSIFGVCGLLGWLWSKA